MQVNMLKSKIHRATVVQSELDYVGSITVDEELMEAAGIYEYEKVQIADVNNGNRFETYVIAGKKVALFCCIPDADTSMNYLVGMIYSNLFQTLYYVADRKYGGRLPIPVHCIMDEWPNVALPDDFDKILATMRSRGISCSIIIQNIAQLTPWHLGESEN